MTFGETWGWGPPTYVSTPPPVGAPTKIARVFIEQTGAGPRNSKTYAVTSAGLEAVRRWLRETSPDRRVRSDAALRGFFLWLLAPGEAERQLDDERSHWQRVLDGYRRIQDEPTGHNTKARTFRIMLAGGIRVAEARLAWLDDAIAEIRSDEWKALATGAISEARRRP